MTLEEFRQLLHPRPWWAWFRPHRPAELLWQFDQGIYTRLGPDEWLRLARILIPGRLDQVKANRTEYERASATFSLSHLHDSVEEFVVPYVRMITPVMVAWEIIRNTQEVPKEIVQRILG